MKVSDFWCHALNSTGSWPVWDHLKYISDHLQLLQFYKVHVAHLQDPPQIWSGKSTAWLIIIVIDDVKLWRFLDLWNSVAMVRWTTTYFEMKQEAYVTYCTSSNPDIC